VVGGFIVRKCHVDIQSVTTDPEGKVVATTVVENALVLRLFASRRWCTAARLTIEVRTPEEQERLDNLIGTSLSPSRRNGSSRFSTSGRELLS
jgi:hypothetical protein